MTKLCPLGHRVHVIKHSSEGHCGVCENVYPAAFLIPLEGKVGKKNYELYARAYRQGCRAGLERGLELHDAASAMLTGSSTDDPPPPRKITDTPPTT